MALWNSKDLAAPPNQTYDTTSYVVDTVKLASICRNATRILNEQKELHEEAAMLSRLLYRMKTKFRCDKGLKFMSKVNRGLLGYLSLNLAQVYSSLEPSPPELGTKIVLAPSRQMMEWVLIRTQGFACLMCNVAQNCEDAAFYMKCRLNLGHVWEVALLSLAIMSRIWTISKYLALCACEWYEEFRSFLDILKPVGVAWLPQDYHLPVNLKTWLNSPVLATATPIKSTRDITNKREEMDKIFTLIELEDENNIIVNETCATVELDNEQSKENLEHHKNLNNASSATEKNRYSHTPLEDSGEPITDSSVTLLNSSVFHIKEELPIVKGKKQRKHSCKTINLPGLQNDVDMNGRTDYFDLHKSVDDDVNIKNLDTTLELSEDAGHEENSAALATVISKQRHRKHPVTMWNVTEDVGEPVKLQDLISYKGSDITNSGIKTSESPKKKRKKMCAKVTLHEQSTVLKLKYIKTLKSAVDIKKFLHREEKLREMGSSDCVTQGLDKLQWHMLTKSINNILKDLKTVKSSDDECVHLMKRARKELKLRIQ